MMKRMLANGVDDQILQEIDNYVSVVASQTAQLSALEVENEDIKAGSVLRTFL